MRVEIPNAVRYQSMPVTVRSTLKSWISATDVGNRFRRNPVLWLSEPEVVEYIVYYHMYLNNGDTTLVKEFKKLRKYRSDTKDRMLALVKRTNLTIVSEYATVNGIEVWMHPKIAIPFIRWVDAKFAESCRELFRVLMYPQMQGYAPLLDHIALPNSMLGLTPEMCATINSKIKSSIECFPEIEQPWRKMAMMRGIKEVFGDNSFQSIPIVEYPDVLYLIDILNRKVHHPVRHIGRFPLDSEDFDVQPKYDYGEYFLYDD